MKTEMEYQFAIAEAFISWYIERSGVMLVTQFPLKNQPKLKSKDIKYQWMEKSLRTEPSLTWTV